MKNFGPHGDLNPRSPTHFGGSNPRGGQNFSYKILSKFDPLVLKSHLKIYRALQGKVAKLQCSLNSAVILLYSAEYQ